MFDVYLAEGPAVNDEGRWHARGTIVLGEYREGFEISLEWWGRAAYDQQWLSAAKRLVSGADRAMFLVSYSGPDATFHFGWPAWRDADCVHIQNCLVLTELLPTIFNPDEAHRSVGVRETHSEDGERISEWNVNLADVRAFVDRRSAPLFPA